MEKEVHQALTCSTDQENLCIKPIVRDSAWLGGSILSELSCFDNFYVTRKEYSEMGESAIVRKFEMQ